MGKPNKLKCAIHNDKELVFIGKIRDKRGVHAVYECSLCGYRVAIPSLFSRFSLKIGLG